jgi:asparagine synthase (glutamine-hydrolysing)
VVFNGEIYNDDELANELYAKTGFTRKGRCDVEVLPPGFELWDNALFDRLRGMFAIAIWDATRQRMTLVRDHLGIKPLYYSDDGITVRFASELKGLLTDPDQRRELDEQQITAFLAQGYCDPDRSIIRSIRQVPPATVLTFGRLGMRQHSWWTPRRVGTIRRMEEGIEAFLALWPKVLQEHSLSDVPVAVLLSGGIDSGLIAAGMRKKSRTPLITARFSSADHDESDLAAMSAKSCATLPKVLTADEPESAEDLFKAISFHVDGQLADSSSFAFLQVAALARRKCKVALTGDGGDEVFAGYPTIIATRLARVARLVAPTPLVSYGVAVCRQMAASYEGRLSKWEVAARFGSGLLEPCPHSQWRRLLMQADAGPLYGPALRPYLDSNPLQAYSQAFSDAEGSWGDKALIADQMHYLPGDLLAKSDLMSMAVGLEIRVPMLDRRIVELASDLDLSLLQRLCGPGKRILRSVATGYGLPEPVVQGAKRGFNVPVARLMRGPLLPLACRYLKDQADALAQWFRPERVSQLIEEHTTGVQDHGYLLWSLLTFSIWYQDYLSIGASRKAQIMRAWI